MKKIVIIIVMFVLTGSAYSQFFSFGPRVGVSASRIDIDRELDYNGDQYTFNSDNSMLGFHAGLFARLSFSWFYLQPEVLFTSSGGKISVNSNSLGEEIQELHYNKLDVPLMLGVKMANFFRIEAGPKFSLLLSDDARDVQVFQEAKQNYRNSTIGYQAGIGFDIWKFYLDFKYEGNLSEFGQSITIGNTEFDTEFDNELIMVVLGFNIF